MQYTTIDWHQKQKLPAMTPRWRTLLQAKTQLDWRLFLIIL